MTDEYFDRIRKAVSQKRDRDDDSKAKGDAEAARQLRHFEAFQDGVANIVLPAFQSVIEEVVQHGMQAEIQQKAFEKWPEINFNSVSLIVALASAERPIDLASCNCTITVRRDPKSEKISIARTIKANGGTFQNTVGSLFIADFSREVFLDAASNAIAEMLRG